MAKLHRSRIQKAKIDGNMLDISIDISIFPEWKRAAIRDMVDVMNDPDADIDDKESANITLADIFFFLGTDR